MFDYGLQIERFMLVSDALRLKIHMRLAGLPSNLGIFLRDSGNAGFFLRDRPRDPQPSHPGKKRGSFQSQLGRCAVRSTDDPTSQLQCFHNQRAIRVFQGR